MKYTKYVYALCLLFSLGACGESSPQNNNNRNSNIPNGSANQVVQASGDYDLTQSSRQECRSIFDTHIRVQQNGSQLSIESIDSSASLSATNPTSDASRSNFADSSSIDAGAASSGQIESIQGSIDSQGTLTLTGRLRIDSQSFDFQCSGTLAGDVASLACQITGMPEASCSIRYERRANAAPNATNPGSSVPLPEENTPPTSTNPSPESCEAPYDLISSSEAECNAMLGSQITLVLADDLRLRSTGEVPQTLQITLNSSGELHLQRPSGRFHAENCQVLFSDDLRRVTFDCAAWERAYDPPSCSVTYSLRGNPACFLE